MKPENRTLLRIATRGSQLALAQAHSVSTLITAVLPDIRCEFVVVTTTGDSNLKTPLFGMGERGIFTRAVNNAVQSGIADIAIHSLKDLSLEEERHPEWYTKVVERENPHDILLVREKGYNEALQTGILTIGTSSLRRKEQATQFLQRCFPLYKGLPIHCNTVPIRGNIITRLQKLQQGEVQALVIALAGVNRLLGYEPSRSITSKLLQRLRWMLLPLSECAPAPGQGALSVMCLREHTVIVQILEHLADFSGAWEIQQERQTLQEFSGGCLQQFGAVTLGKKGQTVLCINGKKHDGSPIIEQRLPEQIESQLRFVRQTADICHVAKKCEHTFQRIPVDIPIEELQEAHDVFISSRYCLHEAQPPEFFQWLAQKRLWAAGITTWSELAKKGLWCSGSTDALGFEYLQTMNNSIFINNILPTFDLSSMMIITHVAAAERWKMAGYRALATYSLHIEPNLQAINFEEFGAFFWTNPELFRMYHNFLPPKAVHICPSGRTASFLQSLGLQPITVPTIFSFELWNERYKP